MPISAPLTNSIDLTTELKRKAVFEFHLPRKL